MTNGTSKRRGAAAETGVAKALKDVDPGMKRYWANTGGPKDLRGDWLVVQVKERKRLTKYLKSAILDAELGRRQLEEDRGTPYTPIAVLHELNSHHLDDIVCMSLREWKSLVKEVNK